MWENLKDRWITWRTGKTKSQRDYEAWYNSTVNVRAKSVEEMFANFKYVFRVNPNKFLIWHFSVEPRDDLRQYQYPQRALGDSLLWTVQRGDPNFWDNGFVITDPTEEDLVYLATNNSEDALMLALKYG
jgi:hypothetical protein